MDEQETLDSLVGRTITAAAFEDEDHPALTLDDGRRIKFEGIGYDGLWTAVMVIEQTS